MSFVKNLQDRLLHLNHLRKYVNNITFSEAVNVGFKHEIISSPPSGNVLVLSPHPDDDIFGCGGVIKKHTLNHDKVKTIYFHNGVGSEKKDLRKQIEKTREDEAIAASEILGVKDYLFCRYDDGKLFDNKVIRKLLMNIINDFRPNVIYAPSMLDTHPDHFEIVRILASVFKEIDYQGTILSYEIWNPVIVNRTINIDDTIKCKVLAMEKHSSQMKERSYKDAFIGLAKYRAGMFNAGEYAESFFISNKKLYLELYKLMDYKN